MYVLKKIIGTDEEKAKQFDALMAATDTHDVKTSENIRGAHSWEAADADEVEDLSVYLKDPTAMLAACDKPKEKTHVPVVPATEETMKLLQQAYDNMNVAVVHIKKNAREVGQRSESYNDFLSDVLTLSNKVSKAITDLDGLLCSAKSVTDAVVRDTLRRHTQLFSSFLNKGSDLNSILVHLKKSEKKGDQKPDAGGKRASRCAHADQ
jgi:hypothetical protein